MYPRLSILAIPAALVLMALPVGSADSGPADYLYSLSDFSGTIPFSDVRLHVDDFHGETYVVFQSDVRVFNDAGMEVYRFGHDERLGLLRDLAVDAGGDIWILSNDLSDATAPRFFVTRCDYRGRPRQVIEVRGLPPGLEEFVPQRMELAAERLLLVQPDRMTVVATDLDGRFVAFHDLAEAIGLADEDRDTTVIQGLTLDRDGNFVFSIATLFKVFVVSPRGEVRAFGRPGSSAGKFGVISGVAADRHGHYLVADRQRSVVMVFDQRFEFVGEFGGYGDRRDNLTRPVGLAVDDDGRLYVTQMRDRGVSVFMMACAGSENRSPADTTDQPSNNGEGGDGPAGFASEEVRASSPMNESTIPMSIPQRPARRPAALMVSASPDKSTTGRGTTEGGGR